eukprot:CAMPEP_0201129284 /NCGR_PEP_ID=MMETSP0850-20130426/36420_1 /ASSEMBLY_ACC=CAM_ASM_000622 /TAXON_ID=183588 /ORGANISM="Pseudo-nitzschia fraudulenta, Strain WWA7" /LENGTH=76 /DNA_ID=CAMNT_0047398717 /DNA_START=261 /DNA_END=491 /DNA_ORIENTATION=-
MTERGTLCPWSIFMNLVNSATNLVPGVNPEYPGYARPSRADSAAAADSNVFSSSSRGGDDRNVLDNEDVEGLIVSS